MEVVRRSLLSEAIEKTQGEITSKHCVTIQGVYDPLFYGLFAAIMTDLRKLIPVDGRLLLVYSIAYAVGTGWRQALVRSVPYTWLIGSRWARASNGLVGPVGYRSSCLNHPLGDMLDWFRALRIWDALQSSSDVSGFMVEDVLVGDLIIDTYLRFRPSPEFKVADRFVRQIIWQVLRDLRRAHRFFSRVKPKLYLSSYSTYVQHGIAVRVALKYGTAVRAYGNLFNFGRKLSLAHSYHTPDTSDYRRDFSSLSKQTEKLAAAEQILKGRLSGVVDTATSYMKASAYEVSTEPVPQVADAVIVFLHDFYDSPHIYPDLIFPDFWAWITFTVDTLKNAKIDFWIKPHPNQIALSDSAYEKLLLRYPDLRIISSKITNLQLATAGMKCGVTMYGTVAHELAYMGIPSVACARHPHHSFDFCRTAYSRDTYKAFLLSPGVTNLTKVEMRNQALMFFYMHNLNAAEDVLELRSHLAKLFKLADDSNSDAASFNDCLLELRRLPAWRTHIQLLAKEVVGNEPVC